MMKKWKLAFGAMVLIFASAVAILIIPIELEILALRPAKSDILLIDPGHGGVDSGAEGAAGISEKNINLNIGMLIRQMAEADGWTVVMTREDDRGLYPEKDRQTIRSLKTADLLARKKIIEDTKPLVAVSVHLNSFKQDPSVRGAQTFYPGVGDQFLRDESKLLAECVQSSLVEGISDGTNRVALSKNDVLLFKTPVVPIIIVECGFLSNPEEEMLLNQSDYQRKIAMCIYLGIMKYTGKEGRPPLKVIENRGQVHIVAHSYK